MSHFVNCSLGCGNQVNTLDKFEHQRVIGWATAGQNGGSDIVLRQRLDEWACRSCVEKMKAGIPIGQGSLV